MKQETTTTTGTAAQQREYMQWLLTRNDFQSLKDAFEIAVENNDSDMIGETIYPLAKAIAYSVIRKCIDPQAGKAGKGTAPASLDAQRAAMRKASTAQARTLQALRQSIAQDTAQLDAIRTASAQASGAGWNDKGDYTPVVLDNDAQARIDYLAGQALADGIDLVQVAALALLQETDTARKAGTLCAGWLDIPRTVKRLARRVYVRIDDTPKFETRETAPIVEVYAAVRKAIAQSRAVQVASAKYTYIDDYATDSTGGLETIYRRAGKYADIGGNESDINGKPTGNYTANLADAQTQAAMVEKLGLTDRQTTILQYRLQGFGYKAIAAKLGVTQRAIAKQCGAIQDKARRAGFIPTQA